MKQVFKVEQVRIDQYMHQGKQYGTTILTIDVDALCRRLAPKAAANKSRRTRLAYGLIVVEVRRDHANAK